MRGRPHYLLCPSMDHPSRNIPQKSSISASSLAIALLAATATPAFAQVSDSWAGLYVGGHVGNVLAPNGGGRIEFDTNLDGNLGDTVRTGTGADAFSTGFCGGQANSPLASARCKDDTGGVDWGVRLGYDWQSGKMVYGVVAQTRSPLVVMTTMPPVTRPVSVSSARSATTSRSASTICTPL